MRFTKIQGGLVNLETVTMIEKFGDMLTIINYVHGTNATNLRYDSKEERDAEFDRLEHLIYALQ